MERKFLRWAWWVFPATGLIITMLTGGGFWAWVNGEMPWLSWRQALTARGILLASAGLVTAGIWRVLLRKTWPGWVVALAMAAGFAVAEFAARIPAAQTTFWLTVRARLYPDEWIPKEVVQTHFRKLEGRGNKQPGVIVCGSSQMIGVGIRLEEYVKPRYFSRRCAAGLMPVQILMMWPYFLFERGDIFIQCRSSFDFVDQEVFGLSWYRAYDSWKCLIETASVVGWKACLRNWRQLLDHSLAASFEGWRLRDAALEVVLRTWGVEKNGKATRPVWPQPTYALEVSEWQQRAFLRIAEKLKASGVEMWVFEGDVNPCLHTAAWIQRQIEIRDWLAAGEENGKWRWIGADKHKAHLLDDDWQDSVHLNATGVQKLTEAIWRHLEPCLAKSVEQ